ncbi:hypothetical protein IKA15_05170 [bacterium]|nr:hypothetical protein [bacterium]
MLNFAKKTEGLTFDEIVNYYKNSCKQPEDKKIGLEYERISLNSQSLKTVDPELMSETIEEFAKRYGWGILYDGQTVLGAIKGKTSISLEPGGQFEISYKPENSIKNIETGVSKIISDFDKIAKLKGIAFLEKGLTPHSTHPEIKILKKNRYLIMAEYLKEQGTLAPAMMRETAGIQINCDYSDEENAILQLKFLNKIMPFMTGLCANSNIRGGVDTGYKSYRALIWKYTDNARSSTFYSNILDNAETFADYIKRILDVPMLFIERGEKKLLINGEITFKEFMENGYEKEVPTLSDYLLHSSLTFGDVRLKNAIEIRNHDANSLNIALGLCAFYKGLLKNKKETKELCEKFNAINFADVEKYGFDAAKYGLDFELTGKIKENFENPQKIIEFLINFAEKNLVGEEKYYLKNLRELCKK